MTIFLGTKEIDHSEVSIDGQTRRKHLAIFGKSGVGKTTLIRNAAVADLHAGNGVTVIDPHGSLIEDLLQSIPRRRNRTQNESPAKNGGASVGGGERMGHF